MFDKEKLILKGKCLSKQLAKNGYKYIFGFIKNESL
jgi:hypothetical protein